MLDCSVWASRPNDRKQAKMRHISRDLALSSQGILRDHCHHAQVGATSSISNERAKVWPVRQQQQGETMNVGWRANPIPTLIALHPRQLALGHRQSIVTQKIQTRALLQKMQECTPRNVNLLEAKLGRRNFSDPQSQNASRCWPLCYCISRADFLELRPT